MKLRKALSLLLLLSLILTFAACNPGGTSDTTPSTDPVDTTAPTLPPETTAPTEPEEAESQLLEPDGEPMTARQLQQLHWVMAQEPGGWYKALLADVFTDPRELNVFRAFGNGTPNPAPDEEKTKLTQEERDMVNKAMGYDTSDRETARIPRQTLEQVLLTYLELTPEDVETMDFGSAVIYWDETDCYYIVQNSYGYIIPYFHEGYTMPDGTIVIYYCDVLATPNFFRAVLRQTEDGIYKILEITRADVDFTE